MTTELNRILRWAKRKRKEVSVNLIFFLIFAAFVGLKSGNLAFTLQNNPSVVHPERGNTVADDHCDGLTWCRAIF